MMRRILIGEDSNVVKNITRRILSSHSYDVLGASNGQEVYDMLLKNSIDIILLDLTMPVLDGISCVEKIRNEAPKEKRDVPIIAVTGNALNLKKEDFLFNKIDDYLIKPLNYDMLLSKIGLLLSR